VVITIGPACQSVDALSALLEAGATCARVDLTWAPIEYHRISLQNLQEAMKRTSRLCAVMLDSLGRELMVKRKYGVDENGWPGIFDQLQIANGARVTITTDPAAECTDAVFPVTYAKFPAMCQPGDSIFVGRYLVTGADASSLFLEVEDVTATEVVCVAKNNAVLDGLLTIFHQERSADALSNLQNDLPCLTDFDRQAIQTLASEFEVDFVSLSYCRSIEDLDEAREFLASIGADHTKLLAKCETRQSLMNFRSVAHASDGVIISRGNLGLDVQAEKMAMVQKAMCTTCAVLGKPALITRVCDSMIAIPRPTRAEATDIANAVLDGVDGILLGAETYRGKYGLDTVRTTVAICREAEAVFDHHNHFEHLAVEAEYALFATDGGGGDSAAGGDGEAQRRLGRSASGSSLMSEANIGFAFSSANLSALARTSSGVHTGTAGGGVAAGSGGGGRLSMSAKLESVATAAVKTADKVGAALIIVVTYSGKTAALVAKYRPKQPIMTLVVPFLKRDGMKWVLEGRSTARQSLITFGLMPILAAPAPSGECEREVRSPRGGRRGAPRPSGGGRHNHLRPRCVDLSFFNPAGTHDPKRAPPPAARLPPFALGLSPPRRPPRRAHRPPPPLPPLPPRSRRGPDRGGRPDGGPQRRGEAPRSRGGGVPLRGRRVSDQGGERGLGGRRDQEHPPQVPAGHAPRRGPGRHPRGRGGRRDGGGPRGRQRADARRLAPRLARGQGLRVHRRRQEGQRHALTERCRLKPRGCRPVRP
jgi:pyruvate kinase